MTALATVESVKSVRPHPNADRLDIITVGGVDSIVSKGMYSGGEKVVLIQPDSILPEDKPWAEEYMEYTSKGRVRAIKLRGEWSEGLIINPQNVPWLPLTEWDVTEFLGVTKFEPPLPQNVDAKGGLPLGIPKTDEERWERMDEEGRIPWGEEVDITLKIDGMSVTAYYVKKSDPRHSMGVCSRTQELKLSGNNYWLDAMDKHDVLGELRDFCEARDVSLALRGEVYGHGIQSGDWNPHSKMERDVAFYSVWNIDERKYEWLLDLFYHDDICYEMGLPRVTMVEAGVALTKDLVLYYANAETLDGQPFEGVVMRGDGFSFKVPNRAYDFNKG